MPDKKTQTPLYLNLSTLGMVQPPNPGPGWVGPERPAETWADVRADPLSALFDLGRGAMTGDAPVGMNVQGLGALLAAAMPMAQGAKALRAATKAAKLSNLTEEAAQQGIKAYHGSPHDFDQFSLSKIGTGEGAQAYGHGLYFAENPSVAAAYKKAGVTDPRDVSSMIMHGARNVKDEHLESVLKQRLAETQSLAHLADNPDVVKDMATAVRGREEGGTMSNAGIQALRRLDKVMGELPKGAMYEVQIHASPDHFLDWDKPLSEQPKLAEAISAKFDKGGTLGYQRDVSGYGEDFEPRSLMRWAPDDRTDMAKLQSLQKDADDAHKATQRSGYDAASRKAADDAIEAYMQYIDHAQQTSGKWSVDPSKTGSDLYKSVVSHFGGPNKGGAEVASQVLRDQFQIPGIRYLDAGSRSAGEGSRNYVIFDDSLVSILKKYGIALPVIEGLRRRAQANGGVISRQDVDGLQ